MQSRLAISAARSCWVLATARNQFLQREFGAAAASASSGRTADPAIHSGEVEKGPDVHYNEPLGGSSNEAASTEHEPNKNKEADTDPLVPPKPPHIPSPRLESYGVNQPLNPHVQQKRQNSTNVAALDEVICAAVDGTPLLKVGEERREAHEKVESDKEYFSHQKASPLSEIEFADTRKPIRRATDATGDYGVGRVVIVWRPEQLDTAEEALRRGAEIFRQNAMRGDPDTFPHSRVLRELRGEWF